MVKVEKTLIKNEINIWIEKQNIYAGTGRINNEGISEKKKIEIIE